MNPLRDDRGQATLEGLFAAMLMLGIFVLIVLFGRYGSAILRAHEAARTLALGAASLQQAWPTNPGPPEVSVDESEFITNPYPYELRLHWQQVGFRGVTNRFATELEERLPGECRVEVSDKLSGVAPTPSGPFGFITTTLNYRAAYRATRHVWRFDDQMPEQTFHDLYSDAMLSSVQENRTISAIAGAPQYPPTYWGLDRFLFGGLRW